MQPAQPVPPDSHPVPGLAAPAVDRAPAPEAAPPPASYAGVGGPSFDPRTGAVLAQTFHGIDARAFRDPRDVARMSRVRLLKGLDFVYSRFLNLGVEQAMALEMVAQAVLIGDSQAPSLWGLLDRAARSLDVRVPALYVSTGVEAGTVSVGHERPFIVMGAGLLDVLNDDELTFVFGRELGHILLGHVTYKMLARSIGVIGNAVGNFTLNVGAMVTTGLEAPLRDWDQFSEFSADRAGLLAVQRIEIAVSALLKLAGGGHRFFDEMSTTAFLAQGHRALYDERPAGTRLSAIVRSLQAGAPLLAARAAALVDWYNGGEYSAIMQGQYNRRR